MRKQYFIYLLLAVFLAGCATTSGVSSLKVDEVIKISGTSYISAVSLSKLYNLDYDKDSITRKIVLSKGDKEVKFMPGSSVALFNNKVRDMGKEARFHQGSVVIPQAFVYKALAPYFREKRKAITKKVPPTKIVGLPPIKRVIIDAGHGGKDPGAIGRNGLKEKDLVLDVAKKLKRKLELAGIDVIMTRESDKFVSLGQRARIANSKDVDFFISIHANAARSKWISGVEVFYISEAIDDNDRSYKTSKNYNLKVKEPVVGKNTPPIVWDLIHTDNRKSAKCMAEFVGHNLSKTLSQRNRGVKQARFYVLKGTNIPAILVEVGFISNPADEKKLKDTSYRNKVAQGVADGIYQYNQAFGKDYYTRH